MPVIDLVRPVRTERHARMGRANRVIAYLGHALRMGRDRGAEMHREHLSAEADAKIGPPLPQRDFDPVDLPADVVVGIVGAHRTTEDQSTRVIVERFRSTSPKRGRRMSRLYPSARSALPTRPGLEFS